MKVCVIGDTHGRTKWEEINPLDYDYVIFLGDYFDSFDVSFEDQMKNFQEIIFLKETYDNVILLLGNHDCHYIWNGIENYSGYQPKHASTINEVLMKHLEKFHICFHIKGYLFTHAGVSAAWLNNHYEGDKLPIDKKIEYLWRNKREAFFFWQNYQGDSYGNNTSQSPIWIRPYALASSKVHGYTHVVGHTQRLQPNEALDIIFCDSPDYYVVIDVSERTWESKKFNNG